MNEGGRCSSSGRKENVFFTVCALVHHIPPSLKLPATVGCSIVGSDWLPTLATSPRTSGIRLVSRSLLLYQAGPFAARVFDVTPTRDDKKNVLLRRLRRPLPFGLADMNVDVPAADAQRIKVVVNGFPYTTATIMSPLTRLGKLGCAVTAAVRRARHQPYPQLGCARRWRLVLVGIEFGGVAQGRVCPPPLRPPRSPPGLRVGCWSCRRPRASARSSLRHT